MAIMIATLLGLTFLNNQMVKMMNAERDAAVMGLRAGVPISLKHRWQLFFDWVGTLTGLVGVNAASLYAILSIAGTVETESFRWFGYVLAALIGWTVTMLALLGGVSDGALIIRTLRAAKMK